MSLFFIILGILDSLCGMILVFPSWFPYLSWLSSYLGIYMCFKGGFFTFAGRSSLGSLIMSLIDVFTGLFLIYLSMNFSTNFIFNIFAKIALLKGLYSLVISLLFSLK